MRKRSAAATAVAGRELAFEEAVAELSLDKEMPKADRKKRVGL